VYVGWENKFERLKGCMLNGENKVYNIILKLIWYKQGMKGWT
jgi:hypothetical protein